MFHDLIPVDGERRHLRILFLLRYRALPDLSRSLSVYVDRLEEANSDDGGKMYWVLILVVLLHRDLGQQPLCLWLTVTREAVQADITRRSHLLRDPLCMSEINVRDIFPYNQDYSG